MSLFCCWRPPPASPPSPPILQSSSGTADEPVVKADGGSSSAGLRELSRPSPAACRVSADSKQPPASTKPHAVRPSDVQLEILPGVEPSSGYPSTVQQASLGASHKAQDSVEPVGERALLTDTSELFSVQQGSFAAVSTQSTRPGTEDWLAGEGAVSASGLSQKSVKGLSSIFPALSPHQLKQEVGELLYIGQGATGIVYRGTIASCPQPLLPGDLMGSIDGAQAVSVSVAVKFMICNTPQQLWQRAKEALLSKLVTHPNLVRTLAMDVTLVTPNTYKEWGSTAARLGSLEMPGGFPGTSSASHACVADACLPANRTGTMLTGSRSTAGTASTLGMSGLSRSAAGPHDQAAVARSVAASAVRSGGTAGSGANGDSREPPPRSGSVWASGDVEQPSNVEVAGATTADVTGTASFCGTYGSSGGEAMLGVAAVTAVTAVTAAAAALHPQIERLQQMVPAQQPQQRRVRALQSVPAAVFAMHEDPPLELVGGPSYGMPRSGNPNAATGGGVGCSWPGACAPTGSTATNSNLVSNLNRQLEPGDPRGGGASGVASGSNAIREGNGMEVAADGMQLPLSAVGLSDSLGARPAVRTLAAPEGAAAPDPQHPQHSGLGRAAAAAVPGAAQLSTLVTLLEVAGGDLALTATATEPRELLATPAGLRPVAVQPQPEASTAVAVAAAALRRGRPTLSPALQHLTGSMGLSPADSPTARPWTTPHSAVHAAASSSGGAPQPLAPAADSRRASVCTPASLLSPLLVGSPFPTGGSRDSFPRSLSGHPASTSPAGYPSTGGAIHAVGGGGGAGAAGAGAGANAHGRANGSDPVPFQDILYHLDAIPGRFLAKVIMEYCDSGTLLQRINAGDYVAHPERGPLAMLAAMRWCLWCLAEVAAGMAHLHSLNIIHGDLKPGNVLLTSDDSSPLGYLCKVSDFGLATALEASEQTITHENWGTVVYMAPESCAGRCRKASDVYSFGVLLWQMCTGQRPYAGLQAGQVLLGVKTGTLKLQWPPWANKSLVKVGQACMRFEPKERPGFKGIRSALAKITARLDQKIAVVEAAGLGGDPTFGLGMGVTSGLAESAASAHQLCVSGGGQEQVSDENAITGAQEAMEAQEA